MRIHPLFIASLLSIPSQLFAADEVKLLSNINIPMVRYGIPWQISQTKVLVKNIAYEKKVEVVFENLDRPDLAETRSEAKYFGPAADGYEVWVAQTHLDKGHYNFHVDYEVSDQVLQGLTAEGKDFDLKDGPVLYQGQAIQQLNTGTAFYDSYASFAAAIQGMGSKKSVQLHYSFDDFQSERVAALKYQIQYLYGYGMFESPSAEGVEMWSTSMGSIPSDVKNIRYYYSYSVDGQEFVDNNFGKNYTMKRAAQGE